MKLFQKILSYVLVAVLASTGTMYLIDRKTTKLDRLEALIDDRFIGDWDREHTEDAAADAMVRSLGDRWSYYLSAAGYAALEEQRTNAYVGVGITIVVEDGQCSILGVEENGPAYGAGIRPGDVLIGADDHDLCGLTTQELSVYVRGEEGSTVVLHVLRDGVELAFPVQRATFRKDVATGKMLDGNIGYVKILNFDDRCAEESIAAVQTLMDQGAEGLIFDVRDNGGGYAHELVKVLDFLLPEGDLFRSVDYTGRESVDVSDEAHIDLPMVVLVNEDSYSAAEFFGAAIQEYEAGVVVGTKTCGKGYFQITYSLGDGSAVGLSVGKYFTPKGKSLIDVGVTPDYPVEVSDEERMGIRYGTLTEAEDPQLQKAMDLLS